jgi:serine/threonine protein kinase
MCLTREVINRIPAVSALLGLSVRNPRCVPEVNIDVSNLERVTVLGSGTFGMVELYSNPDSKELYAIKTMNKASIARSEQVKTQVANEKYILEMADSRFIAKLFKTSQRQAQIFFLFEACLGGELYAVYSAYKLHGVEEHARYYAASVALALEYLHSLLIAYRDLNTENCLLDAEGRLKLTDMGLAKIVVDRTYSVCGTAAYIAPEMMKQGGHTLAVDWWQLGIFSWELLASKPPFAAETLGEAVYKLETQKQLANLGPAYSWPRGIAAATEGARAFLCGMLVYKPEDRVPMQEGGAAKMRALPWFQGFDWKGLEEGSLPAPFVPPATTDVGAGVKTGKFRSLVRNIPAEEYVDDGSGWDSIF